MGSIVETDTLSIVLNPPDGGIDGLAGATVGWGFTVTWTATNDFISFTSSDLSDQTNSSFLSSYTDYIGSNSGPDGIGLGPDPSDPGPVTWTQTFDSTALTGVGAYAISSDPALALPFSTDTGTIVFNFEIYYGYPVGGTDLGPYSYSGDSTAFTVSVDAPPPPPPPPPSSSAPEPSTLGLFLAGAAALYFERRRALTGLC
jgi:hypothetical protein